MVNPMDGAVLDPAGVVKKFGVPPERIVDYLTLVGDAVDNVPGVPKVGPKTALKWLGAYGSLDVLLANAGDIKGKVGENLRESFGHIPLSRRPGDDQVRCRSRSRGQRSREASSERRRR